MGIISKKKIFFACAFFLATISCQTVSAAENADSLDMTKVEVMDTDSFLKDFTTKKKQDNIQKEKNTVTEISDESQNTPIEEPIAAPEPPKKKVELPFSVQPIDPLLTKGNPLLIDLVYTDLPYNFAWKLDPNFGEIYFGHKATTLYSFLPTTPQPQKSEEIILSLRASTRKKIDQTALWLYNVRYDQLPAPESNPNKEMHGNMSKKIQFVDDAVADASTNKIVVAKTKQSPWSHTANALAQFSQNSVSPNWYQGGVNNFSALGILAGKLNYNDKKWVQWDNNFEWRMGFSSISGDMLRFFNTNDDVFKISSKLGLKASGNFYYSTVVDFNTQFFDSYKDVNSWVMRSSFLTPVRLNVGVGLDYKYKKLFSLMVSPISYKYIYVTAHDTVVNHNQFGIKADENKLSELGSSLRAIVSYAPTPEIQLDSKLSFYTNYKSVEIDWEVVCNFIVNRYMSTRISINPRFDNTIISAAGERVKLQYKQLLSVGFSHKFK